MFEGTENYKTVFEGTGIEGTGFEGTVFYRTVSEGTEFNWVRGN
jgi:hypothetical protein